MVVRNYKLNNGFNVGNFLKHIEVDFIYSYTTMGDKYLLLNQDAFGEIAHDIIEKQKKKNRIIIINNDTMMMDAYNIHEDDIILAFSNMGSVR